MWNNSMQPMSVSAILDRTFKTYRDKFMEISLFALLIGGIMNLVISVLQPGAVSLNPFISIQNLFSNFAYGGWEYILYELQSGSAIESEQAILLTLLSLIFSFLGTIFVIPLITGGVVFITLAVFHGNEEERNTLFSRVSKIYTRLLLTGLAEIAIAILLFLAAAIVFIIALFVVSALLPGGFIALLFFSLLLIPFLFAIILFSAFTMFIFPAAVGEDKAGFSAVGRAFELFRRKIWKSVGMFLLCSLITLAIYFVFITIAGLIGIILPTLIITVILSAVQGFVMPIPIIAFTFLYLDIRMTTEGYDLELRAAEALEADGSYE